MKEDIDNEVPDFKKGYWSEDVYVDQKKELYKALGGGQMRKPNGTFSFLFRAICPCAGARLKENLAKAKAVDGNFKGEGFVTGGMYVLRPDGTVAFSYAEDEYGDRADHDELMDAIRRAAA